MGFDGGLPSHLVPEGLEGIARDAAADMAAAGADYALERVRELAPTQQPGLTIPGRVPGTLRASYRRVPLERVTERGVIAYVSAVESSDPVARWIEFGVAPHDVSRKPTGLMVTFKRIDGEKVRAPVKIRHPGFAGRYPLTRAIEEAGQVVREVAQPALTEWAARSEAAMRRKR